MNGFKARRVLHISAVAVLITSRSTLFYVSQSAANTAAQVSASTRRTAAVPKLTYKGTITMFAQAYTPAVPGLKLPPNFVAGITEGAVKM